MLRLCGCGSMVHYTCPHTWLLLSHTQQPTPFLSAFNRSNFILDIMQKVVMHLLRLLSKFGYRSPFQLIAKVP